DQARHPAGRNQPHHPRARGCAPRAVLLRSGDRRRAVDPRPAAAGGRADVPSTRMSYLDSLFGLHGTTAVVTGGTGGVGAASATALARAGANVIVSGRDRGRGEHVVAEIASDGGSAELELADVADAAAAVALADRVLERHPQVDILVNAAGVFARS